MDEVSLNALLDWSTQSSTEFPDIDFDLFDPASFLGNDQPIEELPEILPNHESAAQDTITTLARLVEELSSRVTTLENQ
jgi:hypothetical protein